MVSDDTHDRTLSLLQENNYFSFPKEQLTLMKQEKVAAILDNDAHLALVEGSAYKVGGVVVVVLEVSFEWPQEVEKGSEMKRLHKM